MLVDEGGAVAAGDDDDDDDENENGEDNDDCAAGIDAGDDRDEEDAVSVAAASTDDTIATPAADPFSRATSAFHRTRVAAHSRSASMRRSRSVSEEKTIIGVQERGWLSTLLCCTSALF